MSSRILKLQEKAKSLPTSAGCYLMKNSRGKVIYVGKAKSLKSRVGSYFNNSVKTPKTQVLVSHIIDFDFMITGNETEAFILENNLIKKHSPKYNIQMRDDKSYPYVQVKMDEPFPKLDYERRPKRKKTDLVFGPFVVGSNISEVIRTLTKTFGLRDCSLQEFKRRKKPCLLFQMKQCDAPCVGKISDNDYAKNLSMATKVFEGKGKETIKFLKSKMHELAEKELFEQAQMTRDSIFLIEDFLSKSLQKNSELIGLEDNFDLIGFYEGELEVDVSLYIVRSGLLIGQKNFHFLTDEYIDELSDNILNFVHQYYMNSHDQVPDRVVIDLKNEDQVLLQSALKESVHKGMKVSGPARKFRSLYELVTKHASSGQRIRLSQTESMLIAHNKLKELLKLKERPHILECYDVAIWQGKSPTASQIVFANGKADKKSYRHYHLQERPEGNNDFAMMEELLIRRLDNGSLPDLFVVDGGQAQVNIFVKVLEEKKVDIPVVGIAKARSKENTEERLIIPGRVNPYILKKTPSLFRLLVQMRDEAHRFSRRLHHKEEKKRVMHSWLDEVKGIGPKTKEKIQFKMDLPLKHLKQMSISEIKDYFDINENIASGIKEKLMALKN